MKIKVFNGTEYEYLEIYSLEIEKRNYGYSVTVYVQIQKRIEPLKVEFFSNWQEVMKWLQEVEE